MVFVPHRLDHQSCAPAVTGRPFCVCICTCNFKFFLAMGMCFWLQLKRSLLQNQEACFNQIWKDMSL